MLIDTHCHMNIMVKDTFDVPLMKEFYPTIESIINDAKKADVTKIINVGTSLQESINCVNIAQAFAPLYASIGIHPNDLKKTWQEDLAQISTLEANNKKIVAIGECGLDYHYPDYNKELQKEAFKRQIELALHLNLALIVHTRNAGYETLQCLEEFKGSGLRGVIHCFSEDLTFAQGAINLGFVLGIGGTVTYPKNDQLRTIVKEVGIENIILETDAPYLAPQSIRGKKNSPSSINIIAHYLSVMLSLPYDYIAQVTTNNAHSLFKF